MEASICSGEKEGPRKGPLPQPCGKENHREERRVFRIHRPRSMAPWLTVFVFPYWAERFVCDSWGRAGRGGRGC